MEAQHRAELVQAGRALKEQLTALEAEVEAAEAALQSEGQKLPNLSHPEVIMHSHVRSFQARGRTLLGLQGCRRSASLTC